jgi:hypothetical protein
MAKKTEPELREEFEKYAERESWGAWLIVAALVAEAYSVWQFHTPDKSLAEAVFLAIANLAIAAGVYVEIHFGRKAHDTAASLQQFSDERVAASDARAAEANERALATQLELEKFRKPWSLPVWKLPDFEGLLKPFAGTPYRILTLNDHDPLRMASILKQAFAWAQWLPAPGMGFAHSEGIELMPEYDGLDIRVAKERAGEWLPAAQAIAEVFKSADIAAEARVMESGTPSEAIHIFIGRKV